MKKLCALLVVCLCAATAMFAQITNVALLTHNDEVKSFYGVSAFVSAMAEADNGDYITLSSGRFTAPTITKAVTIRGAGMWNDDTDPLHIISQTIVDGHLIFDIPEEVTQAQSMEGVFFAESVGFQTMLHNASFVKCEFNKGWDGTTTSTVPKFKDVTFLNCVIRNNEAITGNSIKGGDILFVNSIIDYLNCYNDVTSTYIFNCFLYGNLSNLNNCMIYNSVLSSSMYLSAAVYLPSSATAYNCVAGYYSSSTNSTNQSYFSICHGSGNTVISATDGGIVSILNGDTDTYYDLTDEAAAKYLGTDHTQVGLYGGVNPFSAIPNYPRIKKFIVASKPTADGKLDVDIEVSTVGTQETQNEN